MKSNIVSAAAVLICCAILGAVGIFGYSRYKAAQVENAAFRAQLQTGTQDPQALLGTRTPLPGAEASATPAP
jgi:predicted negative regulator of RcsB-dependent stress response